MNIQWCQHYLLTIQPFPVELLFSTCQNYISYNCVAYAWVLYFFLLLFCFFFCKHHKTLIAELYSKSKN